MSGRRLGPLRRAARQPQRNRTTRMAGRTFRTLARSGRADPSGAWATRGSVQAMKYAIEQVPGVLIAGVAVTAPNTIEVVVAIEGERSVSSMRQPVLDAIEGHRAAGVKVDLQWSGGWLICNGGSAKDARRQAQAALDRVRRIAAGPRVESTP